MIVTGRERSAGRVVCGPKLLNGKFVRIISQTDGSGRIEVFDGRTRYWVPAPNDVSFSDVWSAPVVSLLMREQIDEKTQLPRQRPKG